MNERPIYFFLMTDMRARKIATLIRFAQLDYAIEEIQLSFPQKEVIPHLLKTPSRTLKDQNRIINFIIEESACGKGKVRLFSNSFTRAKMQQLLNGFRMQLFPLFEQFYLYLVGRLILKKSKYDSLSSKIKKQICKLETLIDQNSEAFLENSFLAVILVCELFLACKLVFQEKFRKSKYLVFNLCEKIFRRQEFEEFYGKATMCIKEYMPSVFKEDSPNIEQRQEIKQDFGGNSLSLIHLGMAHSPRQNQINIQDIIKSNSAFRDEHPSDLSLSFCKPTFMFFREVFSKFDSKLKYLRYFWAMKDTIECALLEIFMESSGQWIIKEANAFAKLLQIQIQKHLRAGIDFGWIFVMQNGGKKPHIEGIIFIASKEPEEFMKEIEEFRVSNQINISKLVFHLEAHRKKFERLIELSNETAGTNLTILLNRNKL